MSSRLSLVCLSILTTPPRVPAPAQVLEPVLPDSPDQYRQYDDDAAAINDSAGPSEDIAGDNMDQTSSAAPTPVLAPVTVPSPVTTPTRLRREIKPNKKYD